jgi:hypothetical protein
MGRIKKSSCDDQWRRGEEVFVVVFGRHEMELRARGQRKGGECGQRGCPHLLAPGFQETTILLSCGFGKMIFFPPPSGKRGPASIRCIHEFSHDFLVK